ncbi:PKD domain-containing protein, partial [Lysobacter sp. CFH 32150]|uniref:PKD domain-containing protein n=1 Tax=Lysobacter sp. CFH 32150 TaxID=2927128 RepID=UPI0031F323CF
MGAPFVSVAGEKEKDDPGGRRLAMYEWYTDDYSQRGKKVKKHQKKALWAQKYERFMHDAAKRERQRYRALLPQSGTSATMIDSTQAVSAANDTSWINIGPTKANYATNGSTLNVTDTGRVRAIATDPATPATIYVAFSGGGVWKSTDGGAFWNAKTETLGSLSVGTLEMDPNNASTLYLGLGDPFDGTGIGLVKSTDGADTWSDPVILGDSTEIPDIEIAPGNSNIVLVATNKGLYRSTNAGATFTKVTIATGQAVDPYVWTLASGGGTNFVLSLEANPGAAATDGQIWRSTDSGATWTKATGVTDAAGIGRISLASAPSNRNTMYAMAANTGDLANIFKSTNGGSSWTGVAKSGTTYKSYTNTNTESSKLNTLLGGQGWYNHAIVVDPANANIAYFGGQLLLAKTSDGGTTFKQVSNWLAQFSLPYVHADFHAAHFASNGTLYIGTDGGIFRSTDNATTFTDTLNEGIASHLVYQVGSSTNNRNAVIVGLQDNGTRVRVSNSSVFNQEIGGDGFGSDVNQSNANQMLGSLYYSRIYKSTNGGLDFSSACSGITECNNSSTAPFITRLSRWAGDATGNTLYTFSNTKVYKTTNYAGSWSALSVSGLPTSSFIIRNVGVAPSSSLVVGLVASAGRVYLTTNGGTSWTAATAPTNNGSSLSSIAFDQTDRNIVYVTSVAPDSTKTHVWRSADFGATWSAIDSSASGFPAGIPVNMIRIDPVTNTTLYAATHLGVYRSTDSGGTWARYGAGMPLVNVTDLYVAADDSLVRAATFGRAVWELVPGANAAPVANFTSTTSGLTASFTDTSTDSDGTIASRSWNFGDSTTSTTTNPSHTYASGGTYTVALTVTDNGGATNTVSKTVTVTGPANTAPVANFSFTASDLTANFTDSSTDSDGTIASRSWNFGDSTTSTTTNPSHTYAAAGTYSVALTVTDNGGATNTITKSVTVTAPPGNVLTNGVAVTGLAATTGNSVNYTMVVPAGATNLKFVMSGGTGDADMYVKFGSAPTDTVYDCRPYANGNAETCTITNIQAGTYYIRLKAYSSFSGVSLTGSYTEPCTSNCAQTYSNTADYNIPDNNTTGISSPIAVSGRTGNAPTNASISVNVVHPYVGDLKLDLIAPDGTVYNLRSNTGGSADNIVETYTK